MFIKGECVQIRLPKHAASLTLHHNEHKDVYLTAGAWIKEQEEQRECPPDWVSPEQKAKAIETGEVWVLRWYPRTPISFAEIAAADLDVLLAAALEIEARGEGP